VWEVVSWDEEREGVVEMREVFEGKVGNEGRVVGFAHSGNAERSEGRLRNFLLRVLWWRWVEFVGSGGGGEERASPRSIKLDCGFKRFFTLLVRPSS
jgi:hypothetical protein